MRVKSLNRNEGFAQGDQTDPTPTPTEGARRLQDDTATTEEETTTTTDDSLIFQDGLPITQCTHSYILGETTLEAIDNHHVSMTVISSSIASSLWKIGEDLDIEYDVPLCEILDLQVIASVPNGVGTTSVNILSKRELEGTA